MKTLFTSFLFIIVGFSINAQNLEKKTDTTFEKKPVLKVNPIFIINNEIIGNSVILKNIPEENLLNSEFSKDGQLSTTTLYSRELQNRGILKIEADIKFDIKTQIDLNIFFGFKKTNDIYVNGYLIKKGHSILTESIKTIEVVEPDRIILKTSCLNIII